MMGGCFAIIGALIAFACVAGIVVAILLPSIYRNQRPEMQEIWCNRASKIRASFVCDWKPTPPFENLPAVGGTPVDDPFLILTPATGTPDETGSLNGGGAEIGNFPTAQPLPVQLLPTETPIPTVTATFTPTPLPPTALPTAVPTLTPTPIPHPAAYKFDTSAITYQAQTWNNCGPATLTMALSLFGDRDHQSVAARYLKPNPEDKNVSPYQMVNYVNQVMAATLPVNALYRTGGDLDLLKTLVSYGFPVLIEKGYEVSDLGWMGHYLLIIGYDDAQQTFYTYDSYLGHGNSQGLPEDYTELEYYWRHFNYTFIALYDPLREDQLRLLLGDLADPLTAAQRTLLRASQQINENPQDNWAWFNLGRSYTMLGDHQRATGAYDQAFLAGMPWRTLWYLHDPYISYFAVGRYDDILTHAQATESTTVYVEETFYYRGAVLAARGDIQGAINQFNRALSFNNNYQEARTARDALQNGSYNANFILTYGSSG